MNSLFIATPAMVLCFGSIAVLLMGLWIQSNAALLTVALSSLVGAGAVYSTMFGRPSQEAFAGLLVFDPFGLFFSCFAVAVTFLAIVVGAKSKEILPDRRAEFYSIMLALSTGLIFISTANHFLMIYLALETVSILSYTLAGFHRERKASVEASMKYVVYGSMASAIMVYGISLLYGVTGTLELTELRVFMSTAAAADIPLVLWASVLMIFAGMGYKISAAPMHMWTPDVYEGAPTPVSAFLSIAPKAAGFALLIRFFLTGFTLLPSGVQMPDFLVLGPINWPKLIMISAIFTMFMGNLAALAQTSVKRILAYSSIAHAGYALMGLTTQTQDGLFAVLFYLVVYCFMNLGAFWVTSKIEDVMGGSQLKFFRGLGTRQPLYGVVMVIFLFSLVGLPPFAGFIGKFYLFSSIIGREMYGFAVLAAMNSVISLYYYMKIAKALFLEAPEVPMPANVSGFNCLSTRILLVALAVPNFVLGIYWEPLAKIVRSALTLYWGP